MLGLLSLRLALKNTNRNCKNKYKVGQFVRWYESYAEGIMGKDAGYGVVTQVNAYHGQYTNDYISYQVLRNKYGDTMFFEEGYIESNEEYEERMEHPENKT